LHYITHRRTRRKSKNAGYAQIISGKSLNLADLVEKEFEATGRISRGVKHGMIKVFGAAGYRHAKRTGRDRILFPTKRKKQYINSDKARRRSSQYIYCPETYNKGLNQGRPLQ